MRTIKELIIVSIIILLLVGIAYGLTSTSSVCMQSYQAYTPTVTLVGGSGNTTPVYTTNNGRFDRQCGNVNVDVFLNGDGGAEGAGTGQINIALPITAGSNITGNGVGIVGIATNNNENHILHGSIDVSGTTVKLQRWSSIKVLANLTGVDQNDTDRYINLHFAYEIDE